MSVMAHGHLPGKAGDNRECAAIYPELISSLAHQVYSHMQFLLCWYSLRMYGLTNITSNRMRDRAYPVPVLSPMPLLQRLPLPLPLPHPLHTDLQRSAPSSVRFPSHALLVIHLPRALKHNVLEQRARDSRRKAEERIEVAPRAEKQANKVSGVVSHTA